MKTLLAGVAATLLLGAPAAFAIEPIPGSITYHGQPRTKLKKAPVGSPVYNDFFSGTEQYHETYIIQPDRTLKLVDRQIVSLPND
ncbi:MAG: hypothetical protein PW791_12800 [Neorhizobium sp.]|nr:hypothetical protein [Neorhizobium sp.]